MKLKLKNRLPFIIIVTIITLISINYITKFNDFNLLLTNAEKLREQHEYFLKNSPFKNTLKLTREERLKQGLPPNKYYEREWELTMNPATGKPEPNKIFELQKRLKDKSLSKRNPGDAVDNAWVDRGPNNVGGRTRVVLFDPNDVTNKRVFAGGVSGGLWVNPDITNVNSTWTQVSGVPGNMNISCITVDPNDSNTWYIGTGEQYTFGAAVGNGVYKTTDGGANWTNVPVQLAGGASFVYSSTDTFFAGIYYINDIIAWNNNAGTTEVFIGVGAHLYGDASNPRNRLGLQSAGLYRTTDDGTSWSRIESANMEFLFSGKKYYFIPNDFEIGADNTLWMGTITTPGIGGAGGGRVFSSTDGTTWTEAAASPLTTSNRVEIAVSASNANKLYALTEGDGADPHIFVTTDGFATTTELATPEDADRSYIGYDGIPPTDFTRGQAFYDLVIEVDPTNDAIVYVGGIDLFRTTLGENTSLATDWKQISKWSNNSDLSTLNCSIVHADQHAFTFRPGINGNNEAVIGGDGGVYYASSLSTAETNDVFTAMNTDYNVTQFYYGGYGQDTANELIVAGAQDNGSQLINGASAGANSSIRVYGGDGAYSTIDKDGNYMVVSYVYSYHEYRDLPFTTNGYTIDDNGNEGDFINQAGLDHNLNMMYSNGTNTTTGAKQINRYTLGSSGAIKDQLTDALLTGAPTAFKVSPYTTASTTLLVGTDNSKLLKLTNANGTPTWTDISGGSFVGSISAIEFGATENDIFVTFHNYGVTSIWYSADGGATWQNKEGNLPDMPVKCILQNPLVLNEVIVGTELGIWSTVNFNDASPTWVSSYNGMQDVKVLDLDLRTSDNSVLATTFGRGTFTGKFIAADFTITTANSTVTTCTPSDAVFNFDFNANASYNTVTTFSVTAGAPSGATITFNPTSLSVAGTFTMTVGNIGSLAVGDYPMTVTGTGNQTNSIDVILKVRDTSIGTVTTVAPVNEAIGIAVSNLVFDWNADASATSYDIDISTDAGFSTIIETANVATNSYTSTSILNNSTVYYWRVRAKNSCVNGSYSATQKFQTLVLLCNTLTNNTSLAIPDGTGANTAGAAAESIITVVDNITVSDINVTIDISHTYIQDLVISVIAPDATEIVLFDRECNGENDIIVTYDDDAAGIFDCANSAVSAIVIPTNLLSGFNGKSSLGDWTLKVLDYYNNDTGQINSWSIEICQNQTTTNSTFTNTPLTVGTNSTYTLLQAETEATSVGSTASEQVYMLAELPTKGAIKLNNTTLVLGDTFTQNDINIIPGIVTYVNTSGVSTTDAFKVDITNATNGFLPNQQINITIDAALGIDDNFFEKTGISVFPTVSEGEFSISSSKFIGKTTIELYTIMGQKVFVKQLSFDRGNIEHINANHLASGVYILKLTSEALQGSKKIIIK